MTRIARSCGRPTRRWSARGTPVGLTGVGFSGCRRWASARRCWPRATARARIGRESCSSFATRQNEKFERWILGANTASRPGGITPAGARFPAYWVSDAMPIWDRGDPRCMVARGDGRGQAPQTFTYDDSARDDGWRRSGFRTIAWKAGRQPPISPACRCAACWPRCSRMPTRSSSTFMSFDDGYHESWDIESTTASADDGRAGEGWAAAVTGLGRAGARAWADQAWLQEHQVSDEDRGDAGGERRVLERSRVRVVRRDVSAGGDGAEHQRGNSRLYSHTAREKC